MAPHLMTFDVWKSYGGWQWANRYHIVRDFTAAFQTPVVDELVALEKAILFNLATITFVHVAPVPDPGSSGFSAYAIGENGTYNTDAHPIAAPEQCIWVSPTAELGLLGRKTYRYAIRNDHITGSGSKLAYNDAAGDLARVSEAWSTFLEGLDESEASLRIGVSALHPSGRIVSGYAVRERPMSVDTNKQWYNRTPAPPAP